METNSIQFVDPSVSAQLFTEQCSIFESQQEEWRKKGVFLIKKDQHNLCFIFSAPKLAPSPIVFSVQINFANYDVEAPSVKFINPYTGEFLKRKEVAINFIQINKPEALDPRLPPQLQISQQDLLQGGPEMEPFLCVRGIREYHDNPAHTGDSWHLYRTSGEGTLYYILDVLYKHSILYLASYNVTLNPTISFNQQIAINQ